MTMVVRRWRKSSYSGPEADCVEVPNTLDAVRDTKNPSGPELPGDVSALVAAARSGEWHPVN